jgi:Flp pilus assembly protein TadD
MDLKLLADTLTTFMAPALPALASGGEELIKEAGKKLGKEGPGILKTLWAKLRPKVEVKPAAAEAVQDVVKAPEDADAQASLRVQLRKILEADSSLAAEISQILEAAGPRFEVHGSGAAAQGQGNVVAGKRGIAAGRDVRTTK